MQMNISDILLTESQCSSGTARDESQRQVEQIVNKKLAVAMKKVVHLIIDKVDEMFETKIDIMLD